MKKTLYLMRHGQTLFNLRKKIQGSCDSPLTDEGIRQAKIAKKYFENNEITFTAAYSSTQERASDTLEIITENKVKSERLKGIKEWHFGVFESESEDLFPSDYKNFFGKFGGENWEDVEKRTNETLIQIMEKDNHDSVLAVSHGMVCRVFFEKWNSESPLESVPNCAIFKYEYENGKFTFIEMITHDFTK